LAKDKYDKLAASRISNELQSIRDKLKDIERNAKNAVSALSPFNFQTFKMTSFGTTAYSGKENQTTIAGSM